MITINKFGFNNMFSYGEDNIFEVSEPVTQLVGPNGHGKSSIPGILEELLYNKNSRGIKKADIPNRYTGIKGYSGYVELTIDQDTYRLEKIVNTITKVKLLKNGVDVSGHTTTQTYKDLENLLGMDFSTFTKLVYQSMVSSLDFLSATDANRKKFLISLLGLSKYVEAEKTLKEAVRSAKDDVATVQGALGVIKGWLQKNSLIPEVQQPCIVPEFDNDKEVVLLVKQSELANITEHNSLVKYNISVIQDYENVMANQVDVAVDNTCGLDSARAASQEISTKVAALKAAEKIAKKDRDIVAAIKENCHACGHTLEVGNKAEMLASADAVLSARTADVTSIAADVELATQALKVEKSLNIKYKSYETFTNQSNNAAAKLDSTKPTDLRDLDQLTKTIKQLKTDILSQKSQIKLAQEDNAKVIASNATIEFQKEQLNKFTEELTENESKLSQAQILLARTDVLANAMGNKGLISYKIESMVKVFEELINKYLQVLADGEFALSFGIEDTKLALKVHKGGHTVDIKSLSSGEFNKVNTATLLAVRKLMTSISKVDINLLFLDEVVSVLDEQGKNTLIEVLLRENNLNSIVVSHGYTHPLADVISVIKENNISRLDNE